MSVFGDCSAILDVGAGSDAGPFAGGIESRMLYVGVTGDVTVVSKRDGGTHLFKAVPAGALLPIAVVQVKATGTTATNILALY